MWQDTEQLIRTQLTPGETLIWSGRPRQGLVFRPADLPMTVFAVIWLAAVMFITETARSMGSGLSPFPGGGMIWGPLAIFGAAGFVFIGVGLYFLVGRFFVDARVRANTYYGLSDRRVLIITGLFDSRFMSIPLEHIDELNVTRRPDGSGSIGFGRPTYTVGWRGMVSDHPSYPRRYGYRRIEPHSFELIDDVLSVRDLIAQAQMRVHSAR